MNEVRLNSNPIGLCPSQIVDCTYSGFVHTIYCGWMDNVEDTIAQTIIIFLFPSPEPKNVPKICKIPCSQTASCEMLTKLTLGLGGLDYMAEFFF